MKLFSSLFIFGLLISMYPTAKAYNCAGMRKVECCRLYTTLAVRQHRAALALGCGLGGPRFQENYSAHQNWCMSVSESTAVMEDRARRLEIRSCLQRQPRNAGSCNEYASRAVRQYNASVQLHCYYQGARWQDNYTNHHGWCRVVSEAARLSEDRGRRTSLLLCLNR